ncbi:MAG: FMN-binding glutamate synthase family protein, partial [Microthrixaceae bacterium]
MIWWILGAIGAVLVLLVVYDLTQPRRAILRNFPLVGHLRYLLEAIGPELRQYIMTSNDEEKPFSRDERRWVYSSAKGQNNTFGFGTDNAMERIPGYIVVRHSAFPLEPLPGEPATATPDFTVPCAKVLGASHGRARAFRPESIVNVSAMSFGSLSGHAVEAIDRGAASAHCLHNTGEGGVSPHHLHGADLVMQIGTAYFGCRDEDGRFSLERLREAVSSAPVRALEVKLSQGAKPGLGGLLPGAKVTPEIAAARGIPVGVDCKSPSAHAEFHDVGSLIEFVERLADATGLPVGIKSAVGELGFFEELASAMASSGAGPDFVTIDGGEGGTGAAPLVFADHVSLPFLQAFPAVYRAFGEAGIANDVVFVGSARLGLPHRGIAAMALGCDMVNVARESMLAVGCIQAQRCHTGNCPTGVATQRPSRERGLVVSDKAPRVARYLATLRQELLRMARACGEPHPAWVGAEQVALLTSPEDVVDLGDMCGYPDSTWGRPSSRQRAELAAEWPPMAGAGDVGRAGRS